MTPRKLILCTAMVLAAPFALSSAAFAASHQTREFIREQDLNGDGVVTKAEFEIQRRYSYAKIDFDGDGKLNQSEYVAEFEGRLYARLANEADPVRRKGEYDRQMEQAVVRFNVLDKNKDGFIDWDEFLASGLRMFDLHDQNKDGKVDETDVALLAEKEKAEGQQNEFISSGK